MVRDKLLVGWDGGGGGCGNVPCLTVLSWLGDCVEA